MAGANAYDKLIARVLVEIEAGEAPWRKPWRSAGPPRSFSTGKEYRGANRLLLSYQGYTCPYWGTYARINEAGGRIRKGEKGTPILGWMMVDRKDADDAADPAAKTRGQKADEKRKPDEDLAAAGRQRRGSDDDKIPVARTWIVFGKRFATSAVRATESDEVVCPFWFTGRGFFMR